MKKSRKKAPKTVLRGGAFDCAAEGRQQWSASDCPDGLKHRYANTANGWSNSIATFARFGEAKRVRDIDALPGTRYQSFAGQEQGECGGRLAVDARLPGTRGLWWRESRR